VVSSIGSGGVTSHTRSLPAHAQREPYGPKLNISPATDARGVGRIAGTVRRSGRMPNWPAGQSIG
jgi:hypothetical protein